MPHHGPASPQPSATWLVHPVGLGDLGVRNDPEGVVQRARLSQLQELIAAADPQGLFDRVWHGMYEPAAQTPPPEHAHLPLPKLLRGLAVTAEEPIRVRLLLVAAISAGPRFAGLDVSDLCRALAAAVTVARPKIHQELGGAIEIVDVACALPAELEERTVLAELIERHRDPRPGVTDRMAIAWGSGATSTPFSAISAAVRLRLPWSLLDYTSRELSAAVEVDPLAAVDQSLPLAVPYLIRLRLFHELARAAGLGTDAERQVRLTEEQERAVSAMVDLVDRGYRADDPESLRQVAWEALVRWDGTAGFALRRYVIARYHAMCAHLGVAPVETAEEIRKRGNGAFIVPILGKLRELAVARAKEDPTHRPDAWLASDSVEVINRFGSAAHDLKRPSPDEAEQIARWLVQWDGLSTAEADVVTRFGVRPSTGPGSGLLAVWPVGRDDGDGRPSVPLHLVQRGPGEAVEQFLGSGGFPLHALLLATAKSHPAADRQREQLVPSDARDVTASVQLVGPDFLDLALVRSQIRVYLSEILAQHGEALGALLLVPTGPKAVVLAALQELFRISAERAIPLFVRDLAVDATSPLGGLHLWPAAIGHDGPLLTAALGALDRLELDAAARLLAGTTRAADLAVECQALARAFTGRDEDWSAWRRPAAAPPAEDWVVQGRLAQRLDLIHCCASLLEDGPAPDPVVPEQAGRDHNTLLTRFLVLTATVVENWRPVLCLGDDVDGCRSHKWHFLQDAVKKPEGDEPPHPAQGHAAVLLTLRTARNKIPITHNHAHDAEQAVRDAVSGLGFDKRSLPSPWPTAWTPLAFLRAASEAAAPWDLPASQGPVLLDRWDDLRRRLALAIADAGAPQQVDLQ